MQSVVVIGAGVSGLTATRRLAERKDKFKFVTYECADKIGGVWGYTDKVRKDFSEYEHVSACAWLSFRTNSPGILTSFPGFPMQEPNGSFNHRAYVEKYIDDFAAHYELMKYIKTQMAVQRVHPILNDDDTVRIWEVTVKNLKTGEIEVNHFDAVMDCRGRFGSPRIPKIPGIETFTGEAFHTDDFRRKEDYRGKRVVILGLSWSSLDIVSEQLRDVAMETFLAIKPRGIFNFYLDSARASMKNSNIVEKPEIKNISGSTITFEDGTTCEADVLMYGTGFRVERPYLTPECKVEIDGNRVDPLYKFIFNVHYPTLMFIGITYNFMPFVSGDYQATCALNILEGIKKLPDKETMLKDIGREFENQLKASLGNKNQTMCVGANSFSYHRELAEVGGSKLLDRSIEISLLFYMKKLEEDYSDFRNYKYTRISENAVDIQYLKN